MFKKLLVIILILTLTQGMALCAGVLKGEINYSLEDCIEIALKNDPNINIAKGMLKVSKSQIGQAKSDYFPSLNATNSFNFQQTHSQTSIMNNMGYLSGSNNSNINYYQLNLGVNQLIWNFGKTSAKINMQKYTNEARKCDLENAILNSTYRVKLAYYNVLAAKANQDIYERSVKINQLNYDRTKALFQEGLKSKIDVVNAEVYLTDAKIQLINAQSSRESSLVLLNNAMFYTEAPAYSIKNTESFNFQSQPSDKNMVNVSLVKNKTAKNDDFENSKILTSGIEKQNIINNFVFKPLEINVTEAINKAYENRPDLKSLVQVEKASNESLKAIKKMYMPDLSVSAGYNLRKNSDSQNTGMTVAANIGLPTVNLMYLKTKIDEGKSYLEIAQNNIDLSKKNIYFEIQGLYINLQQLERTIPLMGNKISQTLDNFELADGRYTVGLGNFIELQNAQLNYNNAQLSYVQAVFNYNAARAVFEKSMGAK